MINEDKIIRSYKRKILKLYHAAKRDRMSYSAAQVEVAKLCSKVTYSEVIEFKDEAIRRLKELENEG